MKYLLILLISFSMLFSNQEMKIEDDFLQSLEEVSEIATKTKLNIDDSPSFVTVLHNEKLQRLGITTVYDALGLVPGVQLTREATGVPVVIFRGVSQKSEIKLMIDGVTINNTYRGSIYHYLDFPIELVQRIEVIRGSGSVLYGSGAISGVVNIITKTGSGAPTNITYIAGSANSKEIGTYLKTKQGDVNIALDAYYQDNNNKIDATDRHLHDYSVGLKLTKGSFGVIARLKKSDQGNAYGVFGLNDIDHDSYSNINDTSFLQFSYKDALNKDNKIEVLAGYGQYGQKVEALHPVVSLGTLQSIYKEATYFAQTDFISTSINSHRILVGARYESTKTKQSELTSNAGPITPLSKPGLTREIFSLHIVDTFSAFKDIDITAGLRYDNYSDYGTSYSPNLGIVYRLNKTIKLKALFSHAYRAPSWIELTSNPDLKAETSDSFEAGIIYKNNHNHTLRLNAYTFHIGDMITQSTTYIQTSKNTFTGSEIEYSYTPNNNLELNLFASYVDARDENNKELVDIANTLASTTLIYTTNSGISFASYLKYVSSSSRSEADTRGDKPSSLIFDETVSYTLKNFTASLIVKDLFNNGTYYALPQSRGYDFNDGGRSIILRATLEF
ncbi:MAG: TonB-dependent receptor [Sulfurimonas sp.]|nr:TonB-dependent receptor [Sulfurimonas sp.]